MYGDGPASRTLESRGRGAHRPDRPSIRCCACAPCSACAARRRPDRRRTPAPTRRARTTPASSVRAGIVIASGCISARREHGIGVAQQQVGDLVVEQRVLPAGRGAGHAVQDHRPDAPLRRVVVAVGVPADRPVRVRNEVAATAVAGHGHAADRRRRRRASCGRGGRGRTGARAGAAGPCRARCPRSRRSPCSPGRSASASARCSSRGQCPRVAHRHDQLGQPARDRRRASPRATRGRRRRRPDRTGRPRRARARACADGGGQVIHRRHARCAPAGAATDRAGRPCRAAVSAAASGASTSMTCEIAHVRSCSVMISATRWPSQRRNA